MKQNNPIHIPPSSFVRNTRNFTGFCSVTECTSCGAIAKYEDAHPVNPCVFCGNKVIEKVGRWVIEKREILFGLLRKEEGYWEINREIK